MPRLRPLPLILTAAAATVAVRAARRPVQTINALTPRLGLHIYRDLAYGPDARHRLDLYAPAIRALAPTVVFVHGGNWTSGDKGMYIFVGESLARAGFVTAVINYRLAPGHRYPDSVHDTALATAWLHANAARFGGDPARLFLTGHSAGAFNAVALASHPHWLGESGVPHAHLRGVVGIAGPYDVDFRLYPGSEPAQAFPEGGDPALIMPNRFVRLDPPPAPTLLLTAGRDQVVGPEQAPLMAAALRAAGGEVTLQVLPRLDHYTIMGAMSRNLRFLGDTRAAVVNFIRAHAAPAPASAATPEPERLGA